jgi:hypothetical protein
MTTTPRQPVQARSRRHLWCGALPAGFGTSQTASLRPNGRRCCNPDKGPGQPSANQPTCRDRFRRRHSRLPLVPDTGVTIKNMADSLPVAIDTLVDNVLRWHRSVCVAEIKAGTA